MAKRRLHQTSFVSGELSPNIFGRVDRELYYNGAERLRNVLVLPQGGVTRRPGTKYVAGTTGNVEAKLISFQFNVEQTYLLVFTAGEFKVYKDDVLQATVTSAPISSLTLPMIRTMNWTQSADTLVLVHSSIQPIRITRTSDTAWTAASLTLSGIPQFDFGSGNENTWSSTRGWPRSVTFWQSRLWFGGSTQRPQTLWGSKIADFFNFALGTGADDDAIEVTIDDDEVNAIGNLFAGRTLQVFTTGGEFFVPFIGLDRTVTPKTIAMEKATRVGSAGHLTGQNTRNVRPVSSDGATVFSDRGGAVVREFLYLDLEQSYVAEDVSYVSSHLIRNPVACTIIPSSTDTAVEYTYFVNQDGTIAVLNRRRSQSFLSWVLWETKGFFEDAVTVGQSVYVTVRRTIDEQTVRFVEKFVFGRYTDAGTVLTNDPADNEWTGLSYLEGEEVFVRATDGFPLLNRTVDDGEIVTEKVLEGIEVGIPFSPLIRSMSPDDPQGQTILGQKRRIASVNFNLLNSSSFLVNGKYRASLLSLGDIVLNQPTPPFTGWKKMSITGYSREPKIEITQTTPVDLTILSMVMEVTG